MGKGNLKEILLSQVKGVSAQSSDMHVNNRHVNDTHVNNRLDP